MSEIVEFITARLDEDEQTAQAAQQFTNSTPWKFVPDPHGGHHWAGSIEDEPLPGTSENQIAEGVGEAAWGHHIARFDPARALLEVAAHRELLEFYAEVRRVWQADYLKADFVLGKLAAIWSDHPDYQEAWKL